MADAGADRRIGILEEMTLDEVRAFDPEIVIVPIGSTEPHGPHLPYCTDTLLARHTAEGATVIANQADVKALCYPALPISLDVNFTALPFALSFKVRTFMDLLMDLCEQIEQQGVRKIVLINGHGGNPDAIGAFLREWSHRGLAGTAGAVGRAFICSINWPSAKANELIEHPSDHAGQAEVLHLVAMRRDLLRTERLSNFTARQPKVESLDRTEVQWVKPWHLYLPQCAHGDTGDVDREKAERFVRANNEAVAEVIIELARTPWSESFPYE